MAKNAKPRDSRAGFEIFRRAGPDISLHDLNERLKDAGYGPVAKRTLDHYRHLVEAGYNRYISINRFDVARAATRHGDLAASPRYPVYQRGEGVRILVAKSSRLWAASAQVESVGEAGVVLRFPQPKFAEGLRSLRAKKGDEVSIIFLESGIEETGWIAEVDLETEPPLLEMRFSELISLTNVSDMQNAPLNQLGLRIGTVDDDGSSTADQLGRRLFLAFDLIDELRSIANITTSPEESGLYSPPAVVERLSVASPPELWLQVSEIVRAMWIPGSITAALTFARMVPTMRKEWLEGDLLKDDLEMRAAKKEAKEAKRRRDEATSRLADQVTERLAEFRHLSPEERERTQRLVNKNVGRVIQGLAEAGVDEIYGLDDDTDHPEQ